MFKQLANLITLSRLFAIVFLLWMMPLESNLDVLVGIAVFAITAATDFVDGWVARTFNQESNFGRVMDPLADKALLLLFVPLWLAGVIGWLPMSIIFARELLITCCRWVLGNRGVVIPANIWGKVKTSLTMPLIGVLMARLVVVESTVSLWWMPLEMLRRLVLAAPAWLIDGYIWAVVSVTVLSFVSYLRAMWPVVKQGLPFLMTFGNLLMGCLAIYLAFTGHPYALGLVMLGAIFDVLDGWVARALSVQSKYGKVGDTIADLVSFGFAPSALLAVAVPRFGWVIAAVFVAAVAYRLYRFSKQDRTGYFEGLPSTMAAMTLVLLFLLGLSPIVIGNLAMVLALLMVLSVPFYHISSLFRVKPYGFFKWPSTLCLFLTVGLSFYPLPYAMPIVPALLLCFFLGYFLARPNL